MDGGETAALTMEMARSGDMVDLSPLPGIKVDKHSTGGVGDKTTLVVCPIVASCGVSVAKMSGRGLGHTGGTVDKLESIPGFNVNLTQEAFLRQVRNTGLSVVGQTGNLCPADKLLYALRDVTATVENTALIASSVMSKKIAAGCDAIVLDVKCGSGAFMKTVEDAEGLARAMVRIGEDVGRSTIALITDMDTPLGLGVGNSLEVMEAVVTLRGDGPADLQAVCVELAANMLYLAGTGQLQECRRRALDSLADGSALGAFQRMVEAQGGDARCLGDFSLFPRPRAQREVAAPRAGFITAMDSHRIGMASMLLGAGRQRKDSVIDHSAGIVLSAKTGAWVEKGQPIARLYAGDGGDLDAAEEELTLAVALGDRAPLERPLIHRRIDKESLGVNAQSFKA